MRDRSTRRSTFEATLFTFWPPGPPERAADIVTASAGTHTLSVTAISRVTLNPTDGAEDAAHAGFLSGLQQLHNRTARRVQADSAAASGRTDNTGTCDVRTTFSATLPSKTRENPVWP